MIAYVNGRWVDAAEAAVPLADRGFLYGHAVFETARVLHGRLFHLRPHLERLNGGATSLRIPLPPLDALAATVTELVERNGVDDATVRITATIGAPGQNGGLYLSVEPMPDGWRDEARRGWRLITATPRHPPTTVVPSHIKAPGRVYGLLARREALAAGCDDALLLGVDGEITEGPSWNLFWRTGDTLRTPHPETGILEGVTRATIIEVAASLDIDIEEGRWPRSELDQASEIFATMTSRGPVPIIALDGRAPSPPADPWLPAIRDAYWSLFEA